VFSAFIGSYIILYKLTGSVYSFLPLIFPPVMLNQASLVATEIPVIFFILLSFYLFKKGRYSFALLVSAFGFWIRAVAIIPGLIFAIYLLIKNKERSLIYFPFLSFLLILLALFNSHFFGATGIFHQFTVYKALGVNTLGITQIFADFPRAFRWGWYRILISGLFYFSLSVLIFVASVRKFWNEKLFNKTVLFTILASLAFIYSVNSVPFLENLGRYLAPVIPLFWLIFYKKFENKWLYLLLPVSLAVVLL